MLMTETRQGDIVVLAVEGRLDSNTSDQFEKQLLSMVEQGDMRFVLDFGGLDYISSAGLRVLLKAAKELKKREGRLCLCALRDYVREVFDMSGFTAFLPIHPSLEASIEELS
jgi:anti-sigma B factor antagonist